jgi:putative transposase
MGRTPRVRKARTLESDRSDSRMTILPRRRTPAKGVYVDPDQLTILWVTVCSKDRVEWLAQERVMRILHSVWLNEATAWLVGDYLLMPDHVHFFCGLRDSRFTVKRWVAF